VRGEIALPSEPIDEECCSFSRFTWLPLDCRRTSPRARGTVSPSPSLVSVLSALSPPHFNPHLPLAPLSLPTLCTKVEAVRGGLAVRVLPLHLAETRSSFRFRLSQPDDVLFYSLSPSSQLPRPPSRPPRLSLDRPQPAKRDTPPLARRTAFFHPSFPFLRPRTAREIRI
jgi:hypothetical protein